MLMFIRERAIPGLVEEDNELLLDTEAKEKESKRAREIHGCREADRTAKWKRRDESRWAESER